jgi:hypothetical protein
MNKKQLITAATLGIMLGACATKNSSGTSSTESAVKKGECHGVNSCKGTGECGGKSHGCAGKNSCKGQGFLKLTAEQCKMKKGTFKAG